jgi:predicted negative regulator of RcsB-dependent stress response
MSTELMDEHEQGERVRAWLRENGGAIIGGVAIGFGLLYAWQWWGESRVERLHTAATQYEALQEAVDRRDRDAVDALAASIVGDFKGSAYATLALLQLVEQQLGAGELATAVETLKRAVANADHPALADLARIRLARVLISQGEAEAALAQLDALASAGFAAAAAELRGDALQALGRRDAARDAYLTAARNMDAFSPGRRLVEMKLIDAGGTPPDMES